MPFGTVAERWKTPTALYTYNAIQTETGAGGRLDRWEVHVSRLIALLFFAALAACTTTGTNSTKGTQWDTFDECVRRDTLRGGNGSLCNRDPSYSK